MLFGGRLKKSLAYESVHTHRSYGQPPELSEKYRVYSRQMNVDTSSESRKVVKDTEISKILRKKSEIFKISKISKNPKTSF